jgi:hypothetical protein
MCREAEATINGFHHKIAGLDVIFASPVGHGNGRKPWYPRWSLIGVLQGRMFFLSRSEL